METLFITKADFVPYRNITANINDSKRLEPFILEAQRIDLANLLGQRLYFDLVKNITSYNAGINAQVDEAPYTATADEQQFLNLLNGVNYDYIWPDQSTTTKVYAGLRPVLVYLSYARFVRSDNVRSTESGFVKKTVDFSTQVSGKEIQELASRAETDANAFFTSVEVYMRDHRDYLKKYLEGDCSNRLNEKRAGTRLMAVKGRNYLTSPKNYFRR